jgi:expansin (peptidoglycan-binding protein)
MLFRRSLAWLGLAMAGACGGPKQALPLGEKREGVATYYDADGSGACSFEPSSDLDVAALGDALFAQSAACGACYRVKGPRGEVTVRAVDLCPGCGDTHFDLSASAFAKVADPVEGRVKIEFEAVTCEVSGNLAFQFKDGSSQWWTAIQVRNHRLPIQSLEWKKDGRWVPIRREPYNYFVESAGMGEGAVTLRTTASDGQVLEDTLPGVRAEEVFSGAGQFK